MVKFKIPINEPPYKNIEDVALNTYADTMIDGYINIIESKKIFIKRPGLGTHLIDTALNKPIDGVYWWEGKQYYLVISDGKLYKLELTGSTYSLTQITGTTDLVSGGTAIFADWGDDIIGHKCLIATGGKLCYTDGTTLSTVTDADCPTTISHVCVLNRYVIVNKVGSSEWYYSVVNDLTDWSSLDFENAEADPDKIQAVLVDNQKLYVVGIYTTEVWYNDGITPWTRAGVVSHGTLSPYSCVFIDGTLYFLNYNKEFVRLISGTQPQIFSESFNKYIQDFEGTSDAIAYDCIVEGRKFYIINFVTEDRTLFFDYRNDYFGEFGRWNNDYLESFNYNRFLGKCYSFSPAWGVNLVGSRIDGKLYNLKSTNYLDGTNSIRTVKTTGNIDGGTKNKKRSKYIKFTLLRGYGKDDTPNTAPVAIFRYRDNGNKQWSTEYQLNLGTIGDTKSTVELTRLGMYETRQYEIVHSDNSPFMLVEAEEDVEVMLR